MVRKILLGILAAGVAIACIIIFCINGPRLTELQKETGLILLIICGVAALYCFVVGELSNNNSQMDKVWSILPIAYAWVIAGKGNFHPRLVLIAILVSLWGIRLTINFARKGAYSIKFWTGEEDYRWAILRKNKYLSNRLAWSMFDLFFISIYQNLIVLLICLPSFASLGSLEVGLNWVDYLAAGLAAGFLLIETAADEQQNAFQNQKYRMLNEGKKLEELPAPFNRGFNVSGLWNYSRHPNYLGEQMFWVSLIVFSIAAKVGYFNYSYFGAALLILLFLGSTTFAESISLKKYPEYVTYMKKVAMYIPFKRYCKEK